MQLIDPRDKFLPKRSVLTVPDAISHVRSVLHHFAPKDKVAGDTMIRDKKTYTRFYIGITNDIDARFDQHCRSRKVFELMVPVLQEPWDHIVPGSFDEFERALISHFSGGIHHPNRPAPAKPLMQCCNDRGGSKPKGYLYILLGN